MTATTGAFSSIPVLDLRGWADDGDAFADDLVRACHEVGFMLLTGHGVEPSFLDRWIEAVASFFALDEPTKARIDKRRSREFRGWERVGAELTDNRVDFREQLDVCSEHERVVGTPDPVFLRLEGPNQWLPDAVLPGFRALVLEYMARMGAIADTLMRGISRGLGLADDHLGRVFGARPFSLAKLIRYPETPTGECGVNAHHDAGFVTVLMQHGVSGLQALNRAGDWIDVPPTPGTFVINLGEMLQEMSGNYVVAATHRVIATEPRFSSAYFHGPDLRTRLDRLPLARRFAEAVAASPRHAGAGFMATRDELLRGASGTVSPGAGVYGQQLWNYYARSYPANMAAHHADVA
jgi:isopenicillin N synthase-like dioxygenase